MLMKAIEYSNFHLILAQNLNGSVTIQQFVEIFAIVFAGNIDNLLFN